LLLEKGADVNAKNGFGETPLHCACKQGHEENVVSLLLENGAEVNAQGNDGKTSRHFIMLVQKDARLQKLFHYCWKRVPMSVPKTTKEERHWYGPG
jgi:ankyrin repeat protein